MSVKQGSQKKSIYGRRRYWYHVSTTLRGKKLKLVPWDSTHDKAFNRSEDEPNGKRICVSPSIEQCITAIPYDLYCRINIYRTKSPVRASKPRRIFDAKVTHEGWLHKPTTFIKIGSLNFEKVAKKLGIEHVAIEQATTDNTQAQRDVLRWWRKSRIRRFINCA